MRVGILGTGFGRAVHLPALQSLPGVAVTALWGRDRDRTQAIAQEAGIPHAFWGEDWAELYSAVDIVAVTTPPFLHFPQAQGALTAGKPVLLEKPITLNTQQARQLQELAIAQRCPVAVNFEFRLVPAWRSFAELLTSGMLGQLRYVTVDWLVQGRADRQRPWNWYAQRDLGGGVLGAVGSHAFDYLHWLVGPATAVLGDLSTVIPHRPDGSGQLQPVDSDDVANVWLKGPGDLTTSLRLSAATWRGRGHWLTVYGENGTLMVGSPNLNDYVRGFTVQQARPGEELRMVPVPSAYDLPDGFADGRIAPVRILWQRFLAAIAAGAPMVPGLREGLYSQHLMDAVHLSHHQRTWVDVTRWWG
ncbi:MAG TPA: oxidoreductase [Cyanobacteria bacterium UBA8156]|jgi:predicted dehydrogenase|nr:oxidoreductase [Cyanobacteria bacterium UBA8156]